MSPIEVLEYYKNRYKFAQRTGLSGNTLKYWLDVGYVPLGSQFLLQELTNGELKVDRKEKSDK